MSSPTTYSRTQIALHWIIVVLLAFQYLAHGGAEEAMRAKSRGLEVAAINPHVAVGILVLLLVIVRLWLRLTRSVPPLPASEPAPFRLLSAVIHWGFYLFLFQMPLSGMAMWFGGIEIAKTGHEVGKTILLGLIVLHVAGALAHLLYFRTNVFQRMLGRA
jgi:cytochrome b561